MLMLSYFFLQFRQEYLDTLYRYAKFQYECGNYSGAAEYLYFFRVLVSYHGSDVYRQLRYILPSLGECL